MSQFLCTRFEKKSPNNAWPGQYVEVCYDQLGRAKITVVKYKSAGATGGGKKVTEKFVTAGYGMAGLSAAARRDIWADICTKPDLSKAARTEQVAVGDWIYKINFDMCGRAKVTRIQQGKFIGEDVCMHPQWNTACAGAETDTVLEAFIGQKDKMSPCQLQQLQFLIGLRDLYKKNPFQIFNDDEQLQKFLNWKPGVGITGKPYKQLLAATKYNNAFKSHLLNFAMSGATDCGSGQGPNEMAELMKQMYMGSYFGTPSGKGDDSGEGSFLLYKHAMMTKAVVDSLSAFAVQQGLAKGAEEAGKAADKVVENAKATISNALSSFMSGKNIKEINADVKPAENKLFGAFGLKGYGEMDLSSGVFKVAAVGLVGFSIAKKKPLLGILAGVLTFAAFKDLFDSPAPQIAPQPTPQPYPVQVFRPAPTVYFPPPPRPVVQTLADLEIVYVEE